MIRVTALVEGFGDVQAIPVLVGRTGLTLNEVAIAANPIRVGEWKSLKARKTLGKYLELAASRDSDLILIALDLDDGCPIKESDIAKQMIDEWKNGREIRVEMVFFNREYETIFLYCIDNINPGADPLYQPDTIRDAKGSVRDAIGRRYRETQDQAAFSRMLDLRRLYARSRPYRKLCKAISAREYNELDAAFS